MKKIFSYTSCCFCFVNRIYDYEPGICTSISTLFDNRIAGNLTLGTYSTLSLNIATLTVFFVVFYFLAKNQKLMVVKSTIIAMLLGVILGSAILNTLAKKRGFCGIHRHSYKIKTYRGAIAAGSSELIYTS